MIVASALYHLPIQLTGRHDGCRFLYWRSMASAEANPPGHMSTHCALTHRITLVAPGRSGCLGSLKQNPTRRRRGTGTIPSLHDHRDVAAVAQQPLMARMSGPSTIPVAGLRGRHWEAAAGLSENT
jgi:hypothetical protein